jgi:hypothetical protein
MKGTPASAMKAPRQAQDEQDRLAQLEESERLEKKTVKVQPKGKVADLLGAAYVITDWSFTYLVKMEGKNMVQMRVSEWYPTLKVAIDKFYTTETYLEGDVELKKKLFSENGIRYTALGPRNSLMEGIADIESQNVEAKE